jgi:hypothetical protein
MITAFGAIGAALGIGFATLLAGAPPPFHQAYKRPDVDYIYNLLFCDNIELFRTKDGKTPPGPWAVLLAPSPARADLEKIASDEKAESRVRVLAYNRLRAMKAPVPARRLLGVIVEVPLEGGLDTLAAFADGRIRYINQSGKMSIMESLPPGMADDHKQLMAAAGVVVQKIGPWDKARLPPPKAGNVRLTFLASDGLYFGEGPMEAISRDPTGGPVLDAATKLLIKVVNLPAPQK